MNNKLKASIILGGMLLAGVIGGAPAYADTDAATSTSGITYNVSLDITTVCAAPWENSVTWKLRTGQEAALYEWYADGAGAPQSGTGVLESNSEQTIRVNRNNATPGNITMSVRSGKAIYNRAVSQYIGGEDRTCFGMASSTQVVASSTVAEDSQIMQLQEQLISLLRQVIALLMAR